MSSSWRKQCVGHGAGGTIDCQQQDRASRAPVLLARHERCHLLAPTCLPAHALATDPMQWGSTSTGASHAGAYQDTPDRRAPQDDLFPLCRSSVRAYDLLLHTVCVPGPPLSPGPPGWSCSLGDLGSHEPVRRHPPSDTPPGFAKRGVHSEEPLPPQLISDLPRIPLSTWSLACSFWVNVNPFMS